METTVAWGTIAGREITFPMEVTDFNAVTLGLSVPLDAAAALLPGDAFEVLETAPGKAQMIVNVCDYRENPWGDYNEFNLGFLVRPVGAGPEVMGSFIYRMPVDQEFTREAGRTVMGFPKDVHRIEARYTEDRVVFELWDQGALALGIDLPRVASGEVARVEADSYSYREGVAYATALATDMPSEGVDVAEVSITVGHGVIAEELRSLGLPSAVDFCTWGEHLTARFELGSPVRGALA